MFLGLGIGSPVVIVGRGIRDGVSGDIVSVATLPSSVAISSERGIAGIT